MTGGNALEHIGESSLRIAICDDDRNDLERVLSLDRLTKTDITLRNKELIPVSKSRYTEVMDSYMDFRL